MNTILRFCILFTSFSVVHSFFGLQLSSSSSLTNLSLSTATDNMVDAAVVEEVKVGDKVPSIILQEGLPDFGGKKDVNISELIAGKKAIIFGVPGAFTPGCSKSHLPSFINAKDELKEKGIDMIICIATNDLYVMEAWGQQSGGTDAGIVFLSDGSAELTKALGLVMETPMMPRTKRFTLIAEDGVVTQYFSSAEESSNTWAPAVLAKL
jgi:peroxiredoxin